MVDTKIKAIILVGVLLLAIGVPVIIYASSMQEAKNVAPVAKISAPSEGYINMPVLFSASASKDPDGFISLYVWDFGDGTSSAGKYVNHTYHEVGNFTVTLTVYDNSGANSTARAVIHVKYHEEKSLEASVNNLLDNTNVYIGREIKVRGVFAYGSNYSFYMVNNSGYRGIRVYVEPGGQRPETIEYGDLVEVYGRFTVYEDELEVKVENNSRDYVAIIGHGGKMNYVNISADNWASYNNSLVHITSKVTDVYASYKYSMANLTVYVSYGANQTGSPAIGDLFEAKGFLTYYYSSYYGYGYHEIYIRNNTGDFSRYISSNYSDVPIDSLLNDTNAYNNTAIHTEGVVVDSYASWSFDVGYLNNTLHVYVEVGGVVDGMVFNGALVEIWGTVTLYHGTWEIKVRNATTDKVVVKSTPAYEDVPVETLMANPQAYNGSNVHSWGVISWTYHNSSSGLWLFGLFHNGSEVTVVGFNGSNISNVISGYYADVYGEFTSYNGSWEIKIRPDSYDYVVTRPQSYQDVNITEVLKNASRYNNTLVHVPWAVVVSVYNASWLFWVSNSSSSVDMSVYVEKGAIIDDVYQGAAVEIWAQVTQYNGEWEFKVRNATNDTVKVLNQVSYVDVSIEELLNNASRYNNTNVHVPNATVVSVYASWLFWVSNSTNNSNDISVYAESGANVPTVGKGDIIEIYGNVTYHNGSYEIKIRSGTSDKVVILHSSARYVNFSYIHEVDSNGVLVHLGEQVIVNGTVIAPPSIYSYTTSSGTDILKFYIQGDDGGVQVFGYLNYTKLNLSEGDVVQVRGTIDQYNGEAELKVSSLDYITLLNHTSPVSPKAISTGLFKNWTEAEKIEGTLVVVNGTVTDKYVGSSFVKITVDDGSGGIVIFIRNSWGINTTNISVGDNITVVGIVGQYNSSAPYTTGYEIFPRYQSDISKTKASKTASVEYDLNSGNDISCFEVITTWKRKNTALIVEDTSAR